MYMLSFLYYKTKWSVTVLYPHKSYFTEENMKEKTKTKTNFKNEIYVKATHNLNKQYTYVTKLELTLIHF